MTANKPTTTKRWMESLSHSAPPLTTQPRRRDVNDETMREAFEKWLGSFKLSGHALDKNHDGEYRSDRTGDQWEAWQAAWNTRAQASAPEGGEPIAWESTTPAYFKYITQSKYEKISNAAKQWYKPYRCSDCTNASEGDAADGWQVRRFDRKDAEWIYATKELHDHIQATGHYFGPESPRMESRALYTRSNAKAGEVWKPIETAPKDGTAIFACYAPPYDTHGFLPVAVRWRNHHPNAKGKEAFRDHTGAKCEHLTHWMPLPESPTRDKTKA